MIVIVLERVKSTCVCVRMCMCVSAGGAQGPVARADAHVRLVRQRERLQGRLPEVHGVL